MQQMENEGKISEEAENSGGGGSSCKRIERGEKLKGERGFNLTLVALGSVHRFNTLFKISVTLCL